MYAEPILGNIFYIKDTFPKWNPKQKIGILDHRPPCVRLHGEV